MDGTLAIEHNHAALKRIVAMLVTMAGLTSETKTLPRRLRLAVLRLLRPAESATRRLIIAAAWAVVVSLPPLRLSKPKKKSAFLRKPGGTGILLPKGVPVPGARPRVPTLWPAFSLLDPIRRFGRIRRPVQRAIPRVRDPWSSTQYAPLPVRKPPKPDDLVNAVRLRQRLAALGRALDDLPGHAKRFARWRARNAAARAQRTNSPDPHTARAPRAWPIRLRRPFGARRRKDREIDEVLAHTHALAVYALEYPDTS